MAEGVIGSVRGEGILATLGKVPAMAK
jgi:hypothetical protein